jgi:3-hydroxybutyryl-CoA dehydrogenase
MGRGIAQVCATAGCEVRLFDAQPAAVPRAVGAVRDDLMQGVAKGRTTQDDAEAVLARIKPIEGLAELAGSDLVVEAIVEQLEPKQRLFREIEPIVGTRCLLASNTSSLSVTAIASGCAQPARVAGWHFFNPVPRMRVVEVIRALRTAPDAIDALVRLSERIGHRAVVTSDSPGFVVNHAGRAFVTEGLKLLAERAAEHDVLDAILRTCAGFRMGPMELLDLTGLDVSLPVMESIHAQYYGDDRYRPVALARTRMLAGLHGRKSGEGFYRYGDKAPPPRRETPAAAAGAGAWWPQDGPAALPASVISLLPSHARRSSASDADVILVSPLGPDLSATVEALRLDPAKAVAIDPLFAGPHGATLMACPATTPSAVETARAMFSAHSVPTFVIADSPGYVAPRVVACIVNLACEMAQQGIASPADIDVAVRLGLGYPAGPFEWGDRLGARRVLEIVRGLHDTFCDPRYRPSPWQVRRVRLGLPLSAADRLA